MQQQFYSVIDISLPYFMARSITAQQIKYLHLTNKSYVYNIIILCFINTNIYNWYIK